MALEGSLSDFGLADILQLIYFQRKTGVLVLDSRLDRVRLMFIDGNISGVESKRRIDDNRLGKILVKKGLLKEADLQAALEEQRRGKTKLGNTLMKLGLIDRNALLDILGSQATETVIQLFTWKQGTYEFNAQGVPQDKELPLSLDTQHILMEGLRVVDELSVIHDTITLDMVFKRTALPPAELGEEDAEIIELVDGVNDVGSIIDLCGKDSFQVSKALASFHEKGLVESTEQVLVEQLEAATPRKTVQPLMARLPAASIIIGLILTLGLSAFQRSDTLAAFRAAGMINDLRLRIESYRNEHGSYPQGLDQVSTAKDAWGRPFVYRVTEKSFYLFSSGPDGREGTADDLY